MGGCGALLQGEHHTHHGLPLFLNNLQVSGFVEQRGKDAIVDVSIHPVQLLIFEIADAGHKGVAQQVTEGKDDLGIAVGIGRVLANPEDGVVFQQSIQDVQGFPGATGGFLPNPSKRGNKKIMSIRDAPEQV